MSVCPICTKKAYATEAVSIEGVTMHKTCFRCTTCKRTLNAGNFAKNHGVYYCKVHFQQMFREKGNYDEGFGFDRNSTKRADSPKIEKQEPEQKKPEYVIEKPAKKDDQKQPQKAEPTQEETKAAPAPQPEKVFSMSDETKKQLDALVAAVDRLEAVSAKLPESSAAPPVCGATIDSIFDRLDAVLDKLDRK